MMLLLLLVARPLNFYVDPVVYRASIILQDSTRSIREELFYLEFNCAIPYQELSYAETDSGIIAKSRIDFKLVDLQKTDSLIDTLYRQFTIPSFSQAAKEKLKFIVQFGLYIPEGKYEYSVAISSGADSGSLKKTIEVEAQNYKISDLLLASEITMDTSGGYLTKGNLRIVPLPNHRFEGNNKNLYVYYEVYDLIPDTTELQITYLILNTEGKPVRKISRRLEKRYPTQAVNFGINIESIPDGIYKLQVTVSDSSTSSLTKKEVPFEIKRPAKREVALEDLPYYQEIEYFVSPREYKYFNSLNEEGKRLYLKKFWERHNYSEIAPRFEYADAHYSEGTKPGFKTDRGRIYIKFGMPDETEKSTIGNEESKPFEHWQYYNGLEFIFVDVRGTGEFILIWTNAPGEKNQPTLYDYLPISKRRELEK
ncbi:MAG: GWxTD domain-containing protein [candidate division WOR-3 bacterium]